MKSNVAPLTHPEENPRTLVAPPDFESDRIHYDLSDDFFRCCLDPAMCYSSAYFANGTETLAEAQMAKIDRALTALELKPGDRLLEVGHGWGATSMRALEQWHVQVVGLTLSLHHHDYVACLADGRDDIELRIEGWESYEQPCDAIVSFGAFEHFTAAKYEPFFAKCRSLLPSGGRLALQTITRGRGSRSLVWARHTRFILNDIFPGAEIPNPEDVVRHGHENGFEIVLMESLRFHYARTLETWGANLERNRDAAIRATDQRTYDMFMKYFLKSAEYFRSGEYGAHQFVFQAY